MNPNLPQNDILCSHQHEHDTPVADRLCLRCNIFVCNNCVIEFHFDHPKETLKISEIISRGKDEFKTIITKIDNELTKKVQEAKVSNSKKKVDDAHDSTIKSLDRINGLIENLKENEKLLRNKLIQLLTKKLEENSHPSKTSLIQKKKSIENTIQNWDNLSKPEKLFKYHEKKSMQEELNKLLQEQANVSLYGKVEKYVEEFEGNLVGFYKAKDISADLIVISDIISNLQAKINKYCQEIDKQGDIPNIGIKLSPKRVENDIKKSPIKPILGDATSGNENRSNINHLKNNNSPSTTTPTPITPTIPYQTIDEFQYYITFKLKSQEILFIDPKVDKDKAQSLKIDESCFLDYKPAIFPPEYSKHINIHDAIMITGGVLNSNATNYCYYLKVDRNRENNKYTCLVTSYAPMLEKRERHNMIYLDDTKEVFVCGGFYLKSAEKTKLTEHIQSWIPVAPMRESRANATLLYYNHRHVYCFGGFNVSDRQNAGSTGIYLNSCEFIDVKAPNPSWSEVNLDTNFKVNLKLCAMGVIQLKPKEFLLVGGYDGGKYLNDIHEVVFDENIINKIKKVGSDMSLGRGVIFPSSSKFAQFGSTFVNFDFNNKIIQYEAFNNSFFAK